MSRTWMRVELPYATFGVAVEGDMIVDGAPYAYGMGLIGKRADDTLSRLARKGAKIQQVSDDQPQ